jgi:hypothetical protein
MQGVRLLLQMRFGLDAVPEISKCGRPRGRWPANTKRPTKTIMRSILLSTLGAILLLAAFSSCSTTVRTDNGHAVTTGVHAN